MAENKTVECFLHDPQSDRCDKRCRKNFDLDDQRSLIPFDKAVHQFPLKKSRINPLPVDFIQIPLTKTCDKIESIILIGECAMNINPMSHITDSSSSLILCFCPESVSQGKIVRKLADLIENLCVKKITLVLKNQTCCSFGKVLLEKTAAILGSYELQSKIIFVE